MKATIQVNENGSWRNVVTFEGDTDKASKVLVGLAGLAHSLGPRPTWRIKDAGSMAVLLSDQKLRELVPDLWGRK